jgi:hypothetical protein
MGALEENYQGFCPNYVHEFGLCMLHLYGGERGDLADSPMGALEENYQDLLLFQLRPRILPLYAASVWCGRKVISLIVPWERWRKTIKTFVPNNVQEFGSLYVASVWCGREVISLIVPWERWRKTMKTFVPITSKNSASVCGICMVGREVISLIVSWELWGTGQVNIYSTPLQYHLGRALIKYCRKHNVCIIPGKEVKGGGAFCGRTID